MEASHPLPRETTVRLRDGRNIGVLEVGPSEGRVVIHCHGSGSSRLEVLAVAPAAEALGIRVIALDRPGIGLSDPNVHFTLLDWPEDVAEVADALGITRFAVEGMSLGGAFALACAYKIPQRLTACGLISPLPPPQDIRAAATIQLRFLWWLGATSSWILTAYARRNFRLSGGADVASVKRWMDGYIPRLGMADQKLFADPLKRQQAAQAFAEGGRQGDAGYIASAAAAVRPWPFDVEQVTFQNVYLWHGEEDSIVPMASVRLLAQSLPQCVATYYPHEGHYSTVYNHIREIWQTLCP